MVCLVQVLVRLNTLEKSTFKVLRNGQGTFAKEHSCRILETPLVECLKCRKCLILQGHKRRKCQLWQRWVVWAAWPKTRVARQTIQDVWQTSWMRAMKI